MTFGELEIMDTADSKLDLTISETNLTRTREIRVGTAVAFSRDLITS